MLPANPLLNATAPAGPHLPVALLRQYAAGTLAPAAQHRVEAHTLACTRCADVLAGLLQTPAATTDQALAQLQQRLRQRVQQQAAPARLAPRLRRHRWLAPQLAAAATLLLGLVAGGWWTWQQRHHAPAANSAITATPISAAPAAPAAQPATTTGQAATAPKAVASVPVAAADARPATRRARRVRHPKAVPTIAAGSTTLAEGQPLPEPGTLAETQAAATAPAAAPTLARLATPLARSAAAPARPDSGALAGRVAGVAVRSKYDEAARVRADAMPAAPGLPPTPAGGYPALRERLRREAADFKPEAPDQPLSGTVQLRLTIGADGKIQEIKVLHGLRADYDEEAQNLVCDGPAWVPGISGGKRAARAVDITVPFQ